MNLPNALIGGTNKAGTTSVFRYLSDHPDVCGSNIKETGFFTKKFTGNISEDKASLSRHFSHYSSESILLEASTSYLALGGQVVPRINQVIGEPRILFILRNPVDRIYSYFNFQSGNLAIPKEVSFLDYLELCKNYESGVLDAGHLSFDVRHLEALQNGKYDGLLRFYFENYSAEKFKIMLFDDLKSDPRGFMTEVSSFFDIDSAFYNGYRFDKSNVTFSSVNTMIHRLAVFINRRCEPIFRQKPKMKGVLVDFYKHINMKKNGAVEMDEKARLYLSEYYSDSITGVQEIVDGSLPDSWLQL